MANTIVFTKILHLREKEKQDAEMAYQRSMNFFEDVAKQLYTLLRKKEAAEEAYECSLQKPLHIEHIKEQVAYIEMLNSRIASLQRDVQKARAEMETKQGKLTDAHVEVKKFEKIIELRERKKVELARKQEVAFLDDVSIQQYLSRKNG